MSGVTILGAGPAGLMAAHAAKQVGRETEIIAMGEKSIIDGAQWLQHAVPGVTDGIEPTMITYAKVGSVDGYAQKAYGESEAQVSWDSFVSGDRPGWSLRKAYDFLWAEFGDKVMTYQLQKQDIVSLAEKDRVVFCSIPMPSICWDKAAHDFEGQEVMFTDGDLLRIPNMIVYNGRASDHWYRTSCLFGVSSTEYGIHNGVRPPIGPARGERQGIKPIRNNCSCWSSYQNLVRIGRFGTWRRGVLVDHAYIDAKERL